MRRVISFWRPPQFRSRRASVVHNKINKTADSHVQISFSAINGNNRQCLRRCCKLHRDGVDYQSVTPDIRYLNKTEVQTIKKPKSFASSASPMKEAYMLSYHHPWVKLSDHRFSLAINERCTRQIPVNQRRYVNSSSPDNQWTEWYVVFNRLNLFRHGR